MKSAMTHDRGHVIFGHLKPVQGFHDLERDLLGAYVWTKQRFSLRRPTSHPYWSLTACCYGRDGMLSVECGGRPVSEVRLLTGWNTYALDLSDNAGERIDFRLNRLNTVAGDSRELGVMIRSISVLDDQSVCTAIERTRENKRLNQSEYSRGRTRLVSLPPRLRIDIEDRCTVTPACVYCEWEWTKERERPSPFTWTRESLSELGDFFQLAEEAVDCSYGEPLLSPDFSPIVESVTSTGKLLEITSNGQILDARNRRHLLGKRIILYVSLDAATADVYARYRSDEFHRVIDNLRALCHEKKLGNDLPRVIVSFIAMRSNISEFPAFVSLMRDTGVDAVNVRTLFPDARLSKRRVLRGEHWFDYDSESLTWNEFKTFVETAARTAAEKGMHFISTLDFVRNEAAASGPLCSEPWKTMYVLRRGIMPCCFTNSPVASLADRGSLSLPLFLSRVWNSDAYQAIRESLSAGRFSEHCLGSPRCPILRQRQAKTTR